LGGGSTMRQSDDVIKVLLTARLLATIAALAQPRLTFLYFLRLESNAIVSHNNEVMNTG